MSQVAWIAVLAAGLNLGAFGLFGLDKWLARTGRRRVSERTLQLAALLGGWAGAWAGVFAFRHKTRKASFLVPLGIATVLHVALVVWLLR